MKISQALLLLTVAVLAFPAASYAQHGAVRGGNAAGASQQQMVRQQQQMQRQMVKEQQQMAKQQQQIQQAQQRDAATGQGPAALDAATAKRGQEKPSQRRQTADSARPQYRRPEVQEWSRPGIERFQGPRQEEGCQR